MPDVKAASLIVIKQLLAEAGPGLEERFLALLTEEELFDYRRAVPTLWVPIEKAVSIFRKAMSILSPEDVDKGLRSLGHKTALDNLSGIYKALMKVATVPFAVSRSSRMWQTYNNKGRAWAEETPGEKKVTFFVADYPELPEGMRELLCGFIEAVGQMTLAHDIVVKKQDNDPQCWRWIIRWK
jgi:hypothetical protein